MPRHPRAAASVTAMSGSIFSALAGRLAEYPGEVYPLHVGDTWMDPPEGCRLEDLKASEHPGMNRYASPRGMLELLEASAAEVTRRSGLETEPREVLVAAGYLSRPCLRPLPEDLGKEGLPRSRRCPGGPVPPYGRGQRTSQNPDRVQV